MKIFIFLLATRYKLELCDVSAEETRAALARLDKYAVFLYNGDNEKQAEAYMKQTRWQYTTDECTHDVTYTLSRLRGRITVAIDGDTYTLPAGLFGMRAARREIFRLGDEQAILVVEGGGNAELLLGGDPLPPVEKR